MSELSPRRRVSLGLTVPLADVGCGAASSSSAHAASALEAAEALSVERPFSPLVPPAPQQPPHHGSQRHGRNRALSDVMVGDNAESLKSTLSAASLGSSNQGSQPAPGASPFGHSVFRQRLSEFADEYERLLEEHQKLINDRFRHFKRSGSEGKFNANLARCPVTPGKQPICSCNVLPRAASPCAAAPMGLSESLPSEQSRGLDMGPGTGHPCGLSASLGSRSQRHTPHGMVRQEDSLGPSEVDLAAPPKEADLTATSKVSSLQSVLEDGPTFTGPANPASATPAMPSEQDPLMQSQAESICSLCSNACVTQTETAEYGPKTTNRRSTSNSEAYSSMLQRNSEGLSLHRQSRNSRGMLGMHTGSQTHQSTTSVMSVGGFDQMTVLPQYFNPDTQAMRRAVSSKTRPSLTEEEEDAEVGVLSPMAPWRPLWRLLLFLLFVYEYWAVSFELVFLKQMSTPSPMQVFFHFGTAIWFVDICLNFVTGYLEGEKLIMSRKKIIKTYLTFWFWCDLIATLPFDAILSGTFGNVSNINTMLRLAKIPKVLKAFRFLTMLQYPMILQGRGHASSEVERKQKYLLKLQAPVQQLPRIGWCLLAAVFVLALSHLQGCVYAAVCPQEVMSYSRGTQTLRKAFRSYFRSFHWSYMALTTGHYNSTQSSTPSLWMLEVTICTERVLLIVVLITWSVFQALLFGERHARFIVQKEELVKQFKKRKVSMQMQLKILHNLQEQRGACDEQHRVQELLQEFPGDLHRQICVEMRGSALLSLGLLLHITTWHEALLSQLATLVWEETVAPETVLCRAGEPSNAAYHVLNGSLAVVMPNTPDEDSGKMIPDFTDGMWIGEKALVNPQLKRSATIVARYTSNIMIVPADKFQNLLQTLDLWERFGQFCEERIWRGLCGRCGVLGDHFSHNCPMMNEKLSRVNTGYQFFSAIGRMLWRPWTKRNKRPRASVFPEDDKEGGRELMEFLRKNRLEHLGPVLNNLGVGSIQTLKETNLRNLRIHMEYHCNSHLTEAQMHALEPQNIEKFERKLRVASSQAVRCKARDEHLIFLSHYKVEAGTEAALIRSELEYLINQEEVSLAGRHFDVPIFLDSEDLADLDVLRERVTRSHNIVLLLTQGVLLRPWVLVELVTATKLDAHVLLLEVVKPGNAFTYPDEAFYTKMNSGDLLQEKDMAVLSGCSIELDQVVGALRKVFKRIAVPYSPHRPQSIRYAELRSLMMTVKIRDDMDIHTSSRSS